MKKVLLLLAFALTIGGLQAQKFAYVDTQYILGKVPEFKQAQEQLDKISAEWQKDMENKYKEIEELYKAYQAEQILLPDDIRKRREEEIVEKERLAKELQKNRFGLEGELFKKREELIKPVQDKVYNAVKEVAATSQLDIIFDKSSSSANILFADPKYDKSDAVLRKMGIKIGID